IWLTTTNTTHSYDEGKRGCLLSGYDRKLEASGRSYVGDSRRYGAISLNEVDTRVVRKLRLLSNYECIEAIKRPFSLADMPTLAKELIFSEPTTRIERATENTPATFGFGALKLIVRARNPLENGVCWLGKKHRLISLWSAPAKASKKGAVISIHSDFLIHVYTLEKQKHKKT
ncbi:hypothetical protein OSTOST_15824, partial [Ostertagia ostertagi]